MNALAQDNVFLKKSKIRKKTFEGSDTVSQFVEVKINLNIHKYIADRVNLN